MLILINFGVANGATVNVIAAANNPQETVQGIRTNTTTFGKDLAGMLVTAEYEDGTSEVLTWQARDIWVNGDVGSSNIYMEAGDTYNGFHLTTYKPLSSLLLQAAPANSIFDMSNANDGAVGDTPTTKIGYPFEILSGADLFTGNVTAVYSGIVNMAGRAADGDAYTDLLIDFRDITEGGLLGYIQFGMDMDTLAVSGDLVSVSEVPLPASLPFLALGVAIFGLIGRRRVLSRVFRIAGNERGPRTA